MGPATDLAIRARREVVASCRAWITSASSRRPRTGAACMSAFSPWPTTSPTPDASPPRNGAGGGPTTTGSKPPTPTRRRSTRPSSTEPCTRSSPAGSRPPPATCSPASPATSISSTATTSPGARAAPPIPGRSSMRTRTRSSWPRPLPHNPTDTARTRRPSPAAMSGPLLSIQQRPGSASHAPLAAWSRVAAVVATVRYAAATSGEVGARMCPRLTASMTMTVAAAVWRQFTQALSPRSRCEIRDRGSHGLSALLDVAVTHHQVLALLTVPAGDHEPAGTARSQEGDGEPAGGGERRGCCARLDPSRCPGAWPARHGARFRPGSVAVRPPPVPAAPRRPPRRPSAPPPAP